MADEKTEDSGPLFKLLCVCGFCNNHDAEGVTVELNFRELCIYYVCPACKKINKMELKPLLRQPLPRSGIMR